MPDLVSADTCIGRTQLHIDSHVHNIKNKVSLKTITPKNGLWGNWEEVVMDEYDLNPHVWNVQRNSFKCDSGAHYEEFQETNLVLDHNSFSLVFYHPETYS